MPISRFNVFHQVIHKRRFQRLGRHLCVKGHHVRGLRSGADNAEVLKRAPKDWTSKNVQIVLHTNVVNNIPSLPTVVAVHYW